MVEVQLNTVNFPLLLTPRIQGQVVTVTQIKNTYSGAYVNDATTPLTFHLEYKATDGVVTVIDASLTLSNDSLLVFPIPNNFWTVQDTYSVLFYWTVKDTANPPNILEQIYTEQPIILQVSNQHNTKV